MGEVPAPAFEVATISHPFHYGVKPSPKIYICHPEHLDELENCGLHVRCERSVVSLLANLDGELGEDQLNESPRQPVVNHSCD